MAVPQPACSMPASHTFMRHRETAVHIRQNSSSLAWQCNQTAGRDLRLSAGAESREGPPICNISLMNCQEHGMSVLRAPSGSRAPNLAMHCSGCSVGTSGQGTAVALPLPRPRCTLRQWHASWEQMLWPHRSEPSQVQPSDRPP